MGKILYFTLILLLAIPTNAQTGNKTPVEEIEADGVELIAKTKAIDVESKKDEAKCKSASDSFACKSAADKAITVIGGLATIGSLYSSIAPLLADSNPGGPTGSNSNESSFNQSNDRTPTVNSENNERPSDRNSDPAAIVAQTQKELANKRVELANLANSIQDLDIDPQIKSDILKKTEDFLSSPIGSSATAFSSGNFGGGDKSAENSSDANLENEINSQVEEDHTISKASLNSNFEGQENSVQSKFKKIDFRKLLNNPKKITNRVGSSKFGPKNKIGLGNVKYKNGLNISDLKSGKSLQLFQRATRRLHVTVPKKKVSRARLFAIFEGYRKQAKQQNKLKIKRTIATQKVIKK